MKEEMLEKEVEGKERREERERVREIFPWVSAIGN